METLWIERNNKINSPSKEAMWFFLEAGELLDLFETVEITNNKWEKETWYKNINGISTLAIITDYLCQSWKEEIKQKFLNLLKSWGEDVYKKVWLFAIKIWKEKDSTQFWQSLMESNEEKLLKSNSVCYPVIPSIVMPVRYNREPNILIHEYFKEQLNIN